MSGCVIRCERPKKNVGPKKKLGGPKRKIGGAKKLFGRRSPYRGGAEKKKNEVFPLGRRKIRL